VSSRTRESDVDRKFSKFGPVRRVELLNGYGFIEFDDYEDSRDARKSLDGYEMDGRRWVVEEARSGPRSSSTRTPRRDEPRGAFEGTGIRGGGVRGRRENCLLVTGLGSRTTWRELKDWARQAGSIEYTDIWHENGKKLGIIKYDNDRDSQDAVKTLDDTKCDGHYVRLTRADEESRSQSRYALFACGLGHWLGWTWSRAWIGTNMDFGVGLCI